DDTVAIRMARSEVGQGTITGLAQLVVEELECDTTKITTEYPTPGHNLARNPVWGSYSTGGSLVNRPSNDRLSKGGAAAHLMIVEAAANQWGVLAAECSVAKGVITHKGSGRSVRYGQVAEAAAKLEPPKEIPLKDPKDWKVIGQPMKR